jgi:hypothetical protein
MAAIVNAQPQEETCAVCHLALGMDRAKGYIGKPAPSQVIEVCGRM